MNVTAKNLLKIGVAAFLLYLAIYFWPAICECLVASSPIFIGCIIAYVVNIIMRGFERIWFPKAKARWVQKSRRPICIALSFFTLCAVITLIGWIIIPQLSSCISLLFTAIPQAITDMVEGLIDMRILPEDAMNVIDTIDWPDTIGSAASAFGGVIGNLVLSVVSLVSSVVGGVITAFLSVIFSVYILLSKDRLMRHGNYLIKRFLDKQKSDRALYILKVLNESFRGFIIGQCTEAVILGVLCFIGMCLLRMPYAAMISALIAFTALIPIAGAYAGGIIGGIMIFTVSPIQALIFVIYLIILQQLEGNLIYPKVVGTNVGLPALWVLVAVTVGGGILGVLGMLLGVPLAAALYRITREDLKRTDPNYNKELQTENAEN